MDAIEKTICLAEASADGRSLPLMERFVTALQTVTENIKEGDMMGASLALGIVEKLIQENLFSPSVSDSRQAFEEAYARAAALGESDRALFEADPGGSYWIPSVQQAWQGWQLAQSSGVKAPASAVHEVMSSTVGMDQVHAALRHAGLMLLKEPQGLRLVPAFEAVAHDSTGGRSSASVVRANMPGFPDRIWTLLERMSQSQGYSPVALDAQLAAEWIQGAGQNAARYQQWFESGLPMVFKGDEYHDKPSLDAAIDADMAAERSGINFLG